MKIISGMGLAAVLGWTSALSSQAPRAADSAAAWELAWGAPIPAARGTREMIAATSSALSVRAGFEALLEGGTAVDAVLTHALADVVQLAGCCVTHAGMITLVYFDAQSDSVIALNAGWNTVSGETEPLTIPGGGTPTGRSVLVPGFMAGVEAAHRRFGRLPWERIFQPAIGLAERGSPLSRAVAGMMAGREAVLRRRAETRSVFLRPDGSLYRAGDTLRQPALAETLRQVARHGADYLYRGPWADRMVAAVRAEGGHLTAADLANYRVRWSPAVQGRYRDYQVYTLGPPNVGGTSLIEALNLAETAGLSGRGHPGTSPGALTDLIRIARVAEVLGASIVPVPLVPEPVLDRYLPGLDRGPESRRGKAWARALWDRMQSPGWAAMLSEVRGRRSGPEDRHSDGVVAVDRYGNVAAMVHTINTTSWGATGIVVDGVVVGDPAAWQQALVARVPPGDRLPDPTNPAIVMREGRPVLASSAIGTGLHEVSLQSILNVLDFGMDPRTAGDTAQFLRPLGLLAVNDAQAVPRGEFPDSVLAAARTRGIPLEEVDPVASGWRGYWVGIRIDPATGRLDGGTTRFFNGRAMGR
jgi:gamma-glutamyltranspeptidase/glutathione hydrolase